MSEGRNTELVSELRRKSAAQPAWLLSLLTRAADALESTSRALSEKEGENTRLRAALAQSDQPCAYCSLPKDEWAKCASGFPGCDRADDAMGCPELGARLALDEALAALKASEERGERLIEACAQAVERLVEIARAECCGQGGSNGYSQPECCGDPDYMISVQRAAAAIRALSALENGPAALADATKKDPGTEQREAGV